MALVMELFKHLKELRRKFGLIKRVFERRKQVLLIPSQMEEFQAGRIWVQYAGGIINRELISGVYCACNYSLTVDELLLPVTMFTYFI